MKRKTEKQPRRNELRREYDLSKLKGRVRGKYAARYRAGTNLVLLSPDVAHGKLSRRAKLSAPSSNREGAATRKF